MIPWLTRISRSVPPCSRRRTRALIRRMSSAVSSRWPSTEAQMGLQALCDMGQTRLAIETSGEAFYREAASRARDRDVRLLFEDLAYQEERHYRTFERLLAQVGGGAEDLLAVGESRVVTQDRQWC